MIKFSNRINEVKSFVINNSDKNLYWISSDRLYYKIKDKLSSIEFPSSVVYIVEGLVFSGKNFYYDPENNAVNIIKDLEGYYYTNLSNKKIILFSGDDLLLYNFQTKEIIWKHNYFDNSNTTLIKDNIFINYSEDQIDCYDFNKNNTLWKFRKLDISNSFDSFFSQEIISYKNKLFVNLISNEIVKNYIIDISTGNILKQYSGLYGQMILEKDRLYFLSPDHISILNTETQEVSTHTITNIFDTTEIKRLLFPRWAIQDGIIYFTQSGGVDMHSGSRGAIFGAFDIKKKSILWYQQLPKGNGIIGSIEVQEDKIFLHTQDKTLYIYEKEE